MDITPSHKSWLSEFATALAGRTGLSTEGRVIQVAVEVPTGNGGARVDRYEVAEDGALTRWHYCRPPHERETSISSPAVWICPDCSTRWTLQVRTYYTTESQDRDDAGNYDY